MCEPIADQYVGQRLRGFVPTSRRSTDRSLHLEPLYCPFCGDEIGPDHRPECTLDEETAPPEAFCVTCGAPHVGESGVCEECRSYGV